MEKSAMSTDVEEDIDVIYQIENALFENYYVLPLVFYNDNIAVNKDIENISLDGNGNIKFNIIKK